MAANDPQDGLGHGRLAATALPYDSQSLIALQGKADPVDGPYHGAGHPEHPLAHQIVGFQVHHLEQPVVARRRRRIRLSHGALAARSARLVLLPALVGLPALRRGCVVRVKRCRNGNREQHGDQRRVAAVPRADAFEPARIVRRQRSIPPWLSQSPASTARGRAPVGAVQPSRAEALAVIGQARYAAPRRHRVTRRAFTVYRVRGRKL